MNTWGPRAQSALCIAAMIVASGAAACAEPDDDLTPTREEQLGESVSQPIVGGQPATAYTEAALINGPGHICSGAVIAPKVVLTAGHCVGSGTYTVVAPYAGNQSAKGSQVWTDYVQQGQYVNPNKLDVAVIILDKAITLSTYPTLASAAAPPGTKAINVGRIRNGTASYTGLFYGAEVTLRNGASYGFSTAYVSEEIIQSGDSGGPVYVGSGASRKIVAVNSGGGGGTQVLARVDLAYAKIQQLIAANGGAGGSSAGSGSGSGSGSGGSSGSSCTGTPEVEPNDTSTSANALSGTRCGALSSGSDVDWYGWTVSGAGVNYAVELTTTGDADVLMWKWTGSAWSKIANTSATKIAATSTGPGDYVIAVRSQGGNAQPYAITLTK
ncbi:MAG: trypsin-like serine protease [Labilithrix sp.]|nr:trypsin-like serine protease [Labilithrix sp.]